MGRRLRAYFDALRFWSRGRKVRQAGLLAAATFALGWLLAGVGQATSLALPLLGPSVLEGSHDLYLDSTGTKVATETLEARLLQPGPLGTQALVLAADFEFGRPPLFDLSAVQDVAEIEMTEGVRWRAGHPAAYIDLNWAW